MEYLSEKANKEKVEVMAFCTEKGAPCSGLGDAKSEWTNLVLIGKLSHMCFIIGNQFMH